MLRLGRSGSVRTGTLAPSLRLARKPSMPLPRARLRTLMIAVAAVGVALALDLERERHLRVSHAHRQKAGEFAQLGAARRQDAAWRRASSAKCKAAADSFRRGRIPDHMDEETTSFL